MANLGRRAALLAVTLLALAASGGPLAQAGPGAAHPYFNDRGTLTWYRSFEEARAAARAEGRLLFIEFGRRECRNCRVIVETILPATGIRERMASLCVGFAAECDSPDPRVEALFARHLPGANALPFVAFTTPDLEWISGWPGVAGADVLLQHLRAAEARRPARPVRAAPPVERHEAPPAVRVATGVTVAAVPLPTRDTPVPPPPPPPAPIADPLPVAVAAPRPTDPEVEAPTAPRAATPSAPVPPRAPVGAVADLLPRARAASVAGRHGEALSLWKEARGLPAAGSADAWAPVVARAEVWAEEHLRAAVRSAREHRWSEAAEHIAAVRREAPERPCAKDAAVGERAIERLRLLEGGSGGGSTLARGSAAAEFHGTRWTRVFVPLP